MNHFQKGLIPSLIIWIFLECLELRIKRPYIWIVYDHWVILLHWMMMLMFDVGDNLTFVQAKLYLSIAMLVLHGLNSEMSLISLA